MLVRDEVDFGGSFIVGVGAAGGGRAGTLGADGIGELVDRVLLTSDFHFLTVFLASSATVVSEYVRSFPTARPIRVPLRMTSVACTCCWSCSRIAHSV